MNKKIVIPTMVIAALTASILAVVGLSASAQPETESFTAELNGYEEAPPVSTSGMGGFMAEVSHNDKSIDYELNYSHLMAHVVQVHIHFGQMGVNGGTIAFLCQTSGFPDPTGLAPQCSNSGTVKGKLKAANVIGAAEQGISPGEFDELIDAMRAGLTYINVHTQLGEGFERGEIRGQVGQ